ncbi:MAG TPA: hydrogenase formation protein HypD [Caproiciproducens sp.]|nr:hydrogenase formation protein HypD [Caproiciproducens sp.]
MLDYKEYLKNYDGEPVRLMEVCGTHTAAISHSGIVSLLSPKIKLISGPGCPVCVTVTAYIDRLVELALQPNHVVVSFGDLLRVKGSSKNLNDAKALGGQVRMVYSPLDTLKLAESEPDKTFVFAAVGFETTTPVYAMLLEEAMQRGIKNIKLLTSLKTMPQVIDWVCSNQSGIDGFIAPGHVSVITGSELYHPLAEKYSIPFVVASFEAEPLLLAIYALVKRRGRGDVLNLYPSTVTAEGNLTAQRKVAEYFEPCDASWRGMGTIKGSGVQLKPEYSAFDAGSANLTEDHSANPNCRCARVLTGAIGPRQCPMFGGACTPQSPQGACMVSTEGSCYQYFVNRRK